MTLYALDGPAARRSPTAPGSRPDANVIGRVTLEAARLGLVRRTLRGDNEPITRGRRGRTCRRTRAATPTWAFR